MLKKTYALLGLGILWALGPVYSAENEADVASPLDKKAPASAVEETRKPRHLILNGDFKQKDAHWHVRKNDPTSALELFEIADKPFVRGARIKINDKVEGQVVAFLQQDLQESIQATDLLSLKVWLRTSTATAVGAVGFALTNSSRVNAGDAVADDDMYSGVPLTTDWKQHEVSFLSGVDYEQGKTRLTLCYAGDPTLIEIGEVVFTGSSETRPTKENLFVNGDFRHGKNIAWTIIQDPLRTKVDVVDLQDGPAKKALRIEVHPQPGDDPWNIFAQQRIRAPLEATDIGPEVAAYPVVLKVWLRSPQSNDIAVRFQQSRPPYGEVFIQKLKLTPQWKEYEIPVVLRQGVGPNQITVVFQLGFADGTIEFADARLTNPEAYSMKRP